MSALRQAFIESVEQLTPRTGRLVSTTTIKAWTVTPEDQGNPRHEALLVDLPEWAEAPFEAAAAATSCLLHKGTIWVLVSDYAERPERRHLLHIYMVKKRTRPEYGRDAEGRSVRKPDHYPELTAKLHVGEGFAPVERWNASMGNPSGRDLTLVEQRS